MGGVALGSLIDLVLRQDLVGVTGGQTVGLGQPLRNVVVAVLIVVSHPLFIEGTQAGQGEEGGIAMAPEHLLARVEVGVLRGVGPSHDKAPATAGGGGGGAIEQLLPLWVERERKVKGWS